MGQRANFVIIQEGTTSLYYGHWGGGTAARDLIWGPAVALTYVRSLPRVHGLLDTTWGEGAALIDLDKRRLLIFESGGNPILEDVGLRRLFLAWLRLAWADFEIYWAHYEMVDMAKYLGLPVAKFATFLPKFACTARQQPSPRGSAPPASLVTLHRPDADSMDYFHPNDVPFLLCKGPKKLLRQFQDKAAHQFAEATPSPTPPSGYLFVDIPQKRLVYDTGLPIKDGWYEKHTPRHWRGWRVEARHGGLFDHWLVTGRSVHELAAALDEPNLVATLWSALQAGAQPHSQLLPEIGQVIQNSIPIDIETSPFAGQPTVPPIDESARHAWLEQIIAHWRRWPDPMATSLSLNDKFDFGTHTA